MAVIVAALAIGMALSLLLILRKIEECYRRIVGTPWSNWDAWERWDRQRRHDKAATASSAPSDHRPCTF